MTTIIVLLHSQAHWLEAFKKEGVPSSAVQTIDQVAAHPQVLACEMIRSIPLEGLGEMRMAGLPVKFSESPGSIRLPPPRLGQHTYEVLKEIGIPDTNIHAWAACKAIGLDEGWKASVKNKEQQ